MPLAAFGSEPLNGMLAVNIAGVVKAKNTRLHGPLDCRLYEALL